MTITSQAAGSVDIIELKLVSTLGVEVPLKEFLVELNIYEDIFAPTLHGTIILSDSRNLINTLPIIGEETLRVEVKTPVLDISIKQEFRVYAVTDISVVRDQNTQVYMLHFCSYEAIVDSLITEYRPMEGKIADVVGSIYLSYLNLGKPLNILEGTKNKVKFVSPGWSPIKCINWLANQAIPETSAACNFLFWESTKSFYFGPIEKIYKHLKETKTYGGDYKYQVSSVGADSPNIKNLPREYFIATTVEILDQQDKLAAYSNGYYANEIYTVDINKKQYVNTAYDHPEQWEKYTHSEPESSIPPFYPQTARNPGAYTKFYSSNTWLHDNVDKNISEVKSQVWGNRHSNLQDLRHIKLNIEIPGRTDIEVGWMIHLDFPMLGPRSEADFAKSGTDNYYTGYYLVSAMRHKITPTNHRIFAEIVKDSLKVPEND